MLNPQTTSAFALDSVKIFDTPPPERYDPLRDLLARLRPGQWVSLPHKMAEQLAKAAANAGVGATFQPISETESSVYVSGASSTESRLTTELDAWRAQQSETDPRTAWFGTAVELLASMRMAGVTTRCFGKELSQLARYPDSGVSVERASKRGNVYRVALQRLKATSEPETAPETP